MNIKTFVLVLLVALMALFSTAGASAQQLGVTQDCSNADLVCTRVGFVNMQSQSLVMIQQVDFVNDYADAVFMTPQGHQAFLEGFNSQGAMFIAQADISESFVDTMTINQNTQPFEIFVYEGKTDAGGTLMNSELVFLNVNGTLYTIIVVNDPDVTLEIANNLVSGGDFREVPLGYESGF